MEPKDKLITNQPNEEPNTASLAKTADPSTTASTSQSTPDDNRNKVKKHLKFGYTGPVILLIDTTSDYCWTVWFGVGLGLMNLFIGAVNMMAFAYSVTKEDAHAALCTFAFHFFSAEAILCMNYANGWSTPMRLRHRKLTHVLLQICGMSCAITGTVLVIISNGVKASPHGLTGLITVALGGVSSLTGLCAFFWRKRRGRRCIGALHMTFGMPTFLASSISLCMGFVTKDFKAWAPSALIFILIGFVSFYSTFIVISICIKCISRIT